MGFGPVSLRKPKLLAPIRGEDRIFFCISALSRFLKIRPEREGGGARAGDKPKQSLVTRPPSLFVLVPAHAHPPLGFFLSGWDNGEGTRRTSRPRLGGGGSDTRGINTSRRGWDKTCFVPPCSFARVYPFLCQPPRGRFVCRRGTRRERGGGNGFPDPADGPPEVRPIGVPEPLPLPAPRFPGVGDRRRAGDGAGGMYFFSWFS